MMGTHEWDDHMQSAFQQLKTGPRRARNLVTKEGTKRLCAIGLAVWDEEAQDPASQARGAFRLVPKVV